MGVIFIIQIYGYIHDIRLTKAQALQGLNQSSQIDFLHVNYFYKLDSINP